MSLPERHRKISGSLEMFPESSKGRNRVLYQRVGQASLENLPGLFIAT
jgi:hypothetical protein